MLGAIVERGQDDVEGLEELVGKVETSIGQDVDFKTVEDSDLRVLRAQPENLVALTGKTVERQGAGRGRSFRVIGDGDVFVSERDRRRNHDRERVLSVAVGRVHVQIAANI